jgi:hypothetical protein
MMTAVIRGRRPRRQPLIDYPSPPTWNIGAERYYCRMWTPETEPGSAKPGRGGRRKWKARKRIDRLWFLWFRDTSSPHAWSLLMQYVPHVRTMAKGTPEAPGRRERRRRAKLRRRRERAEARVTWREETAALVDHSVPWEPAVTGWQPFDSGEILR